MDSALPLRRYLTSFDSTRTGHVLTDVLVIGGGVAGLSAAISAAHKCQVIVINKTRLDESSTFWAQGGVAAVMSPPDTIECHIKDTLTVGAGLNRPQAVELVCRAGPERIAELLANGLPFDRSGDDVALGLEGGHSRARILHAGGDATGRELGEFLVQTVQRHDAIRIFEDCFLIDLLTVDCRCVGAVTYHPKYGHQLIWAHQTILASGGYSQLFRETTNPPGITGDGIAAALRAGALVGDMEMVQFHPTTLYVAGSTRALISEAVRGEGAYLLNKAGERFMPKYHPDAELAPRDVVSRAIVEQLKGTGATSAYLDVRHIGGDRFAERFPTISRTCHEFGIDPGRDLIPVRPAAHFTIGGVMTDLQARTNVPGLRCCGESANCGLHGANRLASNSLLEGLVMGTSAGQAAASDAQAAAGTPVPASVRHDSARSPRTMLDLDDIRNSLRAVMWRNVGIVRLGERLAETVEIIDFWSRFVLDKTFDEPRGWEIQNMLTLARLAVSGALARAESRGVHYRGDHPERNDAEFSHHITHRLDPEGLEMGRISLDFASCP